MTAVRISAAERKRLAEAAEVEIMRYADNHYLWHLHVHGVKLDPLQVLKCKEMDQHNYTVDTSCRRTGKTAVKALWELKFLACNPDQELGCVGPRLDQAKVNIGYMTDAINRSEILSNYVLYKNGRKQLSDEGFQFYNRSKAKAYGIMSQVDGGDLTIADLEEVDDMPKDRLYSNFLLMLGSSRRLGASEDARNDPMIRVTGVFKGADTLESMMDSGQYHVLPLVNVHLGVQLGILQEEFAEKMREELPREEYIRQLLCKRIKGGGFIRKRLWRRAISRGLEAGLKPALMIPGARYPRRGPLTAGLDAGGHGLRPESSRWCLTIVEQLGAFFTPIYVKYWSPTYDEQLLQREIADILDYFRPDCALGDAFGVAVIGGVNDILYKRGVHDINRHTFGESSPNTWPKWWFSPIQYGGNNKHQMATALRNSIHTGRFAIPYMPEIEKPEDISVDDVDLQDWASLHAHVNNITAKALPGQTYLSYKMTNDKAGDDGFDSLMAAIWAQTRLLTFDDLDTVVIAGGSPVLPASPAQEMPAQSGNTLEQLAYDADVTDMRH